MTRDQLIGVVMERVTRAEGGDAGAVLSPSALDDVRHLSGLGTADDVEVAFLLGVFYLLRYRLLPVDGSDREAAIHHFGTVLPRGPDAVPMELLSEVARTAPAMGRHAAGWDDEAVTLWNSRAASSNIDVLTRAVNLLDRAIAAAPGNPGYQTDLCLVLVRRFELTDSMEDVDRAVAAGRSAVDRVPREPGFQNNLGLALRARFDRLGTMVDIVEAVECARRAVALTPADSPDQALYLANLGVALGLRFGHTGELADIDEAISVGDAAVASTPLDDPTRPSRLSHLVNALGARFERSGQGPDIDRAIMLAEEAGAMVDADDPEAAVFVHGFGLVMRIRGERVGSLDDLGRAIVAAELAVARTPDGHPDRAIYLSGLATALLARFEQTGSTRDVDAAIEAGQRALDAGPETGADRALYLNGLSNAFAARAQRVGMLDDLDAAVTLARQAVSTLPPAHPVRLTCLSNLANKLMTRFRRTGFDANRIDAVARAKAAADAVTADDIRYGLVWSNLAVNLRHSYAHTRSSDELHRAVEASRQAVAALPADDPRRAGLLSALGTNLLNLFEARKDPQALDDAISAAETAVAAAASDHPDRAMYLFNLATALDRRGPGDDRVRVLLHEATTSETAAPLVRVHSGKLWAATATAAGDHAAAGLAWQHVFDLLPLLVDQSLDRVDRQHHLKILGGIASASAGTALDLGDPERAWLWLEQGRGTLLSQELATRTDLDALAHAHPTLAAEVERVRGLLQAETPPERSAIDRIAARRRALSAWRSVQVEIRREPGFERFGLPPTVAQLRDVHDGDGAVVAVNPAGSRSVAIVLTRDGVSHIALPNLLAEDALRRANTFRAATHHTLDEARQQMRDVLAWLWDTVAAPVMQHLGHTAPMAGGSGWPRVWWIPTGPLSALPVHAAGYHDSGSGLDSVLDCVVSSYTPTIRALRHARRPRPTASSADGALVVGVGMSDVDNPLWAVAEEVAHVSGVLSNAATLVDADATRDAVCSRLPRARWAHFACHASADDGDPAESSLRLADGRLRVREIMGLSPADGHLAYLSACSTAYSGTGLADEAINLASAFQVAGFRHVIATLWPVRDDRAAGLSHAIYGRIADEVPPALALHQAVREIRADNRADPQAWASHVHFGA